MNSIVKKMICIMIVATMVFSVSACNNKKQSEDKKEEVTVTKEVQEQLDVFSKYVKEKYDAECIKDGDNSFSYDNKVNGEHKFSLGFIHYDDVEKAEEYMTRAVLIYSEKGQSEYKAGAHGVICEPSCRESSEDSIKLPSYIFVRKGTTIWYVTFYEGNKGAGDDFMAAVAK